MHRYINICLIIALYVGLFILPNFLARYQISILITLFMYMVLTYSWSLFSGSTGYISLAVASFFGVGAYLMAILAGEVPVHTIILIAFALNFVLALIIGLSTLRLRGMYFVVFTFGLSELLYQLAIWWEGNITGTVGRIVFPVLTRVEIYRYLLTLTLVIIILYYLILDRSRLGYGLKVIGQDEEVATHIGVNTTLIKIFSFAFTSSFMGVVGALIVPRWTYIDPRIVFNPMISFTVVIMALLGGTSKFYGPLMGVIPIVLLSEFFQIRFPHFYMLILGIFFIIVVFFLGHGLTGLTENIVKRVRRGSYGSRRTM